MKRFGFVVGVVAALSIGGVAGQVAAQQIETAQIRSGSIDVTITGACLGKDAVFRVVNNGVEWATDREFVVYRTAGDIVVNKRKLRMGQGQSASFKVRGAARSGAELGLALEGTGVPSGLDVYHARLKCTQQ